MPQWEDSAAAFRLDGKVAVITGGSRGLGAAIAAGFAIAGADVVVASRKFDNCAATAKHIATTSGRRALPVACHVGRWDDAEVLVDTVYREFGRCDVLVNNAGMSPQYPDLTQVTEELYDKVHAVNARGPFRLSALFGSRMAHGDGGSIINIGTAGALRPDSSMLPYAMAKAGMHALTLALADAWAPKVRANLVMPGAFDTEAHPDADGIGALAREFNPMQRLGRPSDIVGPCLFLASAAGAYVNGAQLLVDGGAFRAL
jgi:NAD(P)-dependent dehydrogenase (short-subunit alcohol dehydrogenase family)